MPKIAVVVPNWNGADSLEKCLDSLQAQTIKAAIVVVDNGSNDRSLELLKKYPEVHLIRHSHNRGFAGGVNPGCRWAIEHEYDYVATFNNDARASTHWLEKLYDTLMTKPGTGIAASKILNADGSSLDSTGEYYTIWGLPYPRGRGETDLAKYDQQTEIFAASGGASLYRASMLKEIGLFDEAFFAYYEDVDLSFRAQLAGWKVAYVPAAIAYHQIGATSSRLRGFTTYQTLKNLSLLLIKNVPSRYFWLIWRRLTLAELLFFGRAVLRGHAWSALKARFRSLWLIPSTLRKRRQIQGSKKVSDKYIWSMMVHDLPPSARALRRLRAAAWKVQGK